jgi:hypothetical protein
LEGVVLGGVGTWRGYGGLQGLLVCLSVTSVLSCMTGLELRVRKIACSVTVGRY